MKKTTENTFKHYYFKFGEKNQIWSEYIKQQNKEIPLSIFFDKWKSKSKEEKQFPWKVDDYYNSESEFKKTFDERHHNDTKQINMFFECGKKQVNNTIFWIFDEIKVYALQPTSEIRDSQKDGILEKYKPEDGDSAKTIPCKIYKEFLKEELPESFATVNSNQKYNRKTIERFDDREQNLANFLLNEQKGDKMKIKTEDMFDYLSPIQFETLIFLIFHHNDIFCATYRGGTLKDIDLKIEIDENSNLKSFQNIGNQLIQIKMQDYRKFKAKEKNEYLIHLGKSVNDKNILGKDWIKTEVKKLLQVEIWLKKSLTFYEII